MARQFYGSSPPSPTPELRSRSPRRYSSPDPFGLPPSVSSPRTTLAPSPRRSLSRGSLASPFPSPFRPPSPPLPPSRRSILSPTPQRPPSSDANSFVFADWTHHQAMRTPLPSSPNESERPAFTPSPTPWIHSHDYYFDDGNVTFQVEGTLYRVHKYFFKRESPDVFGHLLKDPSTGLFGERTTDSQPVLLHGVSCSEFEALLEFMYCAIFTGEQLSLKAWTSILHLSDIWCFDRIKSQAIRRIDGLEGLTPVDKIVLGEKDKVEQWFFPAFVSLVERDEPLSVEEARKLISLGERPVGPVVGMDVLSLLAQGRERLRVPLAWESASVIVGELFGYSRAPSLVGCI